MDSGLFYFQTNPPISITKRMSVRRLTCARGYRRHRYPWCTTDEVSSLAMEHDDVQWKTMC